MRTVYKATCISGTQNFDVVADEMCKLTSGFWVNEEFRFTQGADARWWIPPSAIAYIQKMQNEYVEMVRVE